MTQSLEQQLAAALLRAETAEALLEGERDKVERLEVELAVAKGDVNGMDRAALEKALKELDAKDPPAAQYRASSAPRCGVDWAMDDWAMDPIPRVRRAEPGGMWSVQVIRREFDLSSTLSVKLRGAPAYSVLVDEKELQMRGQQYVGELVSKLARAFRDAGFPMEGREADFVMGQAMAGLLGSSTGRYREQPAASEEMMRFMKEIMETPPTFTDEFIKEYYRFESETGEIRTKKGPSDKGAKAKHDPTPKTPRGRRK